MVREQLRTTIAATQGRSYDIAPHQQAAMPEQLLAHQDADPEHDAPEPDAEPRPTTDLTALRP
ncbi:hypothetical protein AB0E67_29995 [Streptomyces sp. NPDC032161]|uniref:hypothetical protein n=1 Tax=unclassified Streptomyces TaxID=2593676 RepID=UPI0033FA4D87